MARRETLSFPSPNKSIRILFNRPCANQLSASENLVATLLFYTVMENNQFHVDSKHATPCQVLFVFETGLLCRVLAFMN